MSLPRGFQGFYRISEGEVYSVHRLLSAPFPKYGCEFPQCPQGRTIFSIGQPGRYTSGCGQESPAWIHGRITSGPPSVWASEYVTELTQ